MRPRSKVKQILDSEWDWIERARKGDSEAARMLFDSYADRVFRVVSRMTPNREDALEVSQECWLKAFSNLHRFRGKSRFSTWLLRIAMNCAVSRLRKDRSYRVISIEDLPRGVETLPTHPPSQRFGLDRSRRMSVLEKGILTLPPKQRQAFVLRFFDGMKVAEIAEVMKCREGSVKSHLYRASSRLKQCLIHFEKGENRAHESSKRF